MQVSFIILNLVHSAAALVCWALIDFFPSVLKICQSNKIRILLFTQQKLLASNWKD